MAIIRTIGRAVLLLAMFAGSFAQAAQNEWERIDVNALIQTTLPDGTQRLLQPSCSGGPEITASGAIAPASTEFYFFVQKGNPNRIVIGLDGGGACWDATTCVGSPLFGGSTYQVALNETVESMNASQGFFDARNPENPFQNYTKIFIPYCTADVHWGSKDTVYTLLTPNGPLPWLIRHRGTDNFLAVLDWLQHDGRKALGVDLARAHDVTVTGASAGGYGANVAFAYVAELTPRARLSLVSDAAIGVMTQSFYETAIYNPAAPGSENWGVAQNLPTWVPGFDEALLQLGWASPNSFLPSVFFALSNYKPDAKLASLTSNLDGVQIGFYGLMRGVFPPDATIAIEWYVNMAGMTAAAAALPNYRYFIDAGGFHTFIGSDERVYEVGANGITLADWVRAMIKPGNRTWDNLNAGPPF